MAINKILKNCIVKTKKKMLSDEVIYPNLIIVKDGLNEDEPFIQVTTDFQIITIKAIFAEDGSVSANIFSRMRRGTGSEKEFDKKVKALAVLRKYAKKHYKGDAFIIKESLENIKVTASDKIYTLTYDEKEDKVLVKERARRGTKNKDKAGTKTGETENDIKIQSAIKIDASSTINKAANQNKPEPIANSIAIRQVTSKLKNADKAADLKPIKTSNRSKQQVRIGDNKSCEFKFVEDNEYEFLAPGTIVENVYSHKEYEVQEDKKNVIEVSSKENGYQTMARADLIIRKRVGY